MTIEEHLPSKVGHHHAKMSLGSILSNMKLPGLPRPKSLRETLTTRNLVGYPLQEDQDAPIRETAWLDGLRGLAAFLVMIYHYNLHFWFPPAVEAPFGSMDTFRFRENGQVTMYWDAWRLPFIRLLMTAGHAQVSVFFVLSGFVLSWGPLGSILAGRNDKFMQSLGSAVFRRWIRLYLPCFAISLWQCFELYFDLRFIGNKDRKSSIFAQLWDWAVDSEKFANPFMIDRDRWSSLHGYDWTMWTIPYEFAGSLMIFTILLAVGRFHHHRRRMAVIFGVCLYACLRAEWTYWLFANGMLLACYVRYHGGFQKLHEKTTLRSRLGWTALLTVGLLLAGIPEKSEFYDRPGYEWLTIITPWNWREIEGGGRWVWCWSGILFIYAGCHLPSVKRIFEYSFMRYLGRISYMLYLTHRITLNLYGDPVKRFIYSCYGREKFLNAPKDGSEPIALVTVAVYATLLLAIVPVALMVAHWAEILIDAPSTRFARLVDDWFMKGSTKDEFEHQGNGSILPSHAGHVGPEERAIEMQSAAHRESVSREEATALLAEQAEEMREIDPRPLPDR